MEKTFAVTAAPQLGSHALLGALLPWHTQREDSTATVTETLPAAREQTGLEGVGWEFSLKRAAGSTALCVLMGPLCSLILNCPQCRC